MTLAKQARAGYGRLREMWDLDSSQVLGAQGDYEVPLLCVLSGQDGGQCTTAEAMTAFEAAYGHRLPEKHRELMRNGRLVWKSKVHLVSVSLKQRGLLDSPERGVWRITEAGKKWLAENPDSARISGARKRSPSTQKGRAAKPTNIPGVTLDVLERTRSAMPPDLFRQLWGPVYEHLLAQERAKAVTEISQAELASRVRRRLNEIHAFLEGRSPTIPSAEMLCEWIQFCYAVDLCREAAALLAYVHEDEVDPAIFRRAKRMADVCRSRLNG